MVYSTKIKYIFVLFALVIGTFTSMAQLEKNYIFLFDCTGSMRTNGLWETAQSALDNNISLRTSIPGSYFTIIPFGNNPYSTQSFSNVDYPLKKLDITNDFAKYILQARFTNISEVLKSGFTHVNPNKENEIYLFTDGMPNGDDSPQKVAQTINGWCANHSNVKLFYVALTKGVINPVIRQAIEACPDASIVQCEDGIVPVITYISNDVYTYLEELDKTIELPFSLTGSYYLSSVSSDELFNCCIIGGKASNEKIQLSVTPKRDLTIDKLHQTLQGKEYKFPVSIQCADSRFVIANPIVIVHVYDKVPSKLTIAQGVNELQTEGVKWHDSFLWSDALQDKKVVWNLTPIFKNELLNSRICLKFQLSDGQTHDFQAWYNGQPINNGSIISIEPDQPAMLEVLFNHNATTGKRYFSLVPSSIDGLNIINEQPSEKYKGISLRTEYNVVWNPLKKTLLYFTIVLIAASILWLVILKRIFFPTIKMSRVTITGPGAYYTSKRIKGARKVILTAKRKSQNIISRIFIGKKIYIKADFFMPELSIIAAGGKKKVKLKFNDSWVIHPSSIFGQYEKGTLTKRGSTAKTEIDFN